MTEGAQRKFAGLPLSVVGPVDVGRLLRELERIDNDLRSVALRSPDQEVKLSKTSKLMDELVALNKLNLIHPNERVRLQQFLVAIQSQAPVLHISFGADPSPHFIDKLMVYLREKIHPVVLLTIGLQPNIGAGCIVRTTNKYFDFSLGQRLEASRELLLGKLREDTVV